jgi:lysophospholipase L1-like esterase
MNHIVLLGDSIFDNAAYVDGGPPVIQQLRAKLPTGWQAMLLAVDGSMAQHVAQQLEKVATDATHLVISTGGNNAIDNINIISESAQSVSEALEKLAAISEQFQRVYREMLQTVLARKLPTAVCSVYYPNFPNAGIQRVLSTALTIFNDVIIREAFAAGVPLIDLRLVCNETADYANEIEPSVAGGDKITSAILQLIREHEFARRRTEVFA